MITRISTLVTGVSLFWWLSLLEPANAGRVASEMSINPRKTNVGATIIESQDLVFSHKIKGENKGRVNKRFAGRPYSYYEAKGLFETGLEPVFPDGVDCSSIASPYGAQTRYDGSVRKNHWFGYHNGMDISLAAGTPLLAVADAKVIHKGSAGRLVGNFIWLHLAPAATELPIHIFARYQHLDEPSPLSIGDQVRAGEPIGQAGATGTTGGHFGTYGYSHLHLVLYTGPNSEVTPFRNKLKPHTLNFLDPMALYLDKSIGAVTNQELRDLPSDKKKVPVSVQKIDGEKIPEDSKLVWPVSCE